MTTASAPEDDIAVAYMARRARIQRREDLDFLLQGTDNKPPANTPKALSPTDESGGLVDTVLDAAGRGLKDAAIGTTLELPRAVLGGVRDAGQEFLDAVHSLGMWSSENLGKLGIDLGKVRIDDNGVRWMEGTEGTKPIPLPEVKEPDTVSGGIYRDVAQFITGFLPALKGVKMAGVGTKATQAAQKYVPPLLGKHSGSLVKGTGKATEAMLAGAITEATVFDPFEERASDFVESIPALKNPVTDYLKADLEDHEAEARFKRSLEGLGFGALTEGVGLAFRTLRAHRLKKKAESSDIPALVHAESMEEGVEEGLAIPKNAQKPLLEVVEISEKEVAAFQGPVAAGNKVAVPNLERLDTSDDVKELITKTAEVFSPTIETARRGRVSNAETKKLAEDLGMTVENLLSRRQGQAFNAEEALAARQILASSGEQLMALAKKAGTVDASEADLLAFRRALSVHAGIQSQVSGMTAEAGRALQAFRIMAKGANDRERQIRDLIESGGGSGRIQDVAQKLTNIARESPTQFNKSVRELAQPDGFDMLHSTWVNALLSGPKTHAVNIASNSIVALSQMPERFIAAQIGRALGDGGIQAGEVTAQAYGMVEGLKDGLKLAAKTLRTGEGSDLIGKAEESHRALNAKNLSHTALGRGLNFVTGDALERGGVLARGADLLGEVTRVSTRFLSAEDEFFKAVGYRMELHALAYRTAQDEGLTGEALTRRIADILKNPPEAMHLAASDAARYQTFTKPLGEVGQAAQSWIRKSPGLRWVAPFIRTPTNIIKYTGERTPLAVLSGSVRADIAAGGARRDLALARIGLGTMVMSSAADLAASGHITGGGPSSKDMRQHLRNTGWQPYSVKVGDTYYSYNRLDPMGMSLGLAADTMEIMGQLYGDNGEDQGADELAAAAVLAMAKNVTSKTWMTGVSEMIETISSGEEWRMNRFIQRFGGSFVPTASAQINRSFSDPILRDTRERDLWQSILNQARSRIPGYSDDLPPRTNIWGDPIVLSGGLGPDIVSPVYTSDKRTSPADEEIIRLQSPVRMPSRHIDGVELSPHEYHRYVVLAGNKAKDPTTGLGLKDTLNAMIDGSHALSPAYQRATDGPDGGKSLLIRRLVVGFREQAKAQLMKESPELKNIIDARKRKKAHALTGR